MDYEKKYKEALERAKEFQKSKDGLCVLTAESIFPELAESEDEKIRKGLIDIFNTALGQDFLQRKAGLNEKEVIAYLEKQKEHQNNSDARENAHGRDLTFPQDKDKNLDEIAQDYVDGVKEYNSEPTWDLMQTAVCYGYYCREQEEQKPSDLPAGFYFIDQDGNKYYSKEFRFNNGTFTTTMKVKEEQKPWRVGANAYFTPEQKPAEWSEEDKQVVDEIIGSLCDFKNLIIESDSHWLSNPKLKDISREIEWLKSLRPQYHGDVTMTEAYIMGLEAGKASSWKPSEEQMEALKKTIRLSNFGLEEERRKALESLYEQLKKLIV